jgi:hypothetical protein
MYCVPLVSPVYSMRFNELLDSILSSADETKHFIFQQQSVVVLVLVVVLVVLVVLLVADSLVRLISV